MGTISRHKKFVLIISLLIVLMIMVMLFYSKYRAQGQWSERETIFQYIGKSSFDSAYIQLSGFNEGTQYTWWDQVQSEKSMLYEMELAGFTFSESIDYSENYVIVSYGREILDMAHVYTQPRNLSPFLIVTFSEHHDGETVYFYKTEKIGFAPCSMISYCYVMKDGERIFVSKNISGMINLVN